MANVARKSGGGKITKKYRKQRCREIITSYDPDVYFWPYDVEEISELVGVKLNAAMRRVNPRFPKDNAHLYVAYEEDGEMTSFSWVNCIYPKSERQKRHVVMRESIACDIEDFRATAGAECEACGNTAFLQVDHLSPPFSWIADEFLSENGEFEITRTPDGVGNMFADIELEAKWIAFHASHAVFQMLCRSCNASKGAK